MPDPSGHFQRTSTTTRRLRSVKVYVGRRPFPIRSFTSSRQHLAPFTQGGADVTVLIRLRPSSTHKLCRSLSPTVSWQYRTNDIRKPETRHEIKQLYSVRQTVRLAIGVGTEPIKHVSPRRESAFILKVMDAYDTRGGRTWELCAYERRSSGVD